MASKTVVDAVNARLAANWTACPIYGPNERTTTPDDASAFIDVQYPVANTSQLTLDRHYREEGVIRLVINAERGSGSDQGLEWADTLAGLFRTQRFAGIMTWTPSPPVINDENENGNYYQLSLVIPYTFDFHD